jgi:hypothetical protein
MTCPRPGVGMFVCFDRTNSVARHGHAEP